MIDSLKINSPGMRKKNQFSLAESFSRDSDRLEGFFEFKLATFEINFTITWPGSYSLVIIHFKLAVA